MPIFEYRCIDCAHTESLVAGLDDASALCPKCQGLMLRLDEDLFTPYFEVPNFKEA